MKIHLKIILLSACTFLTLARCTNDTASPSAGILSIPGNDGWKITRFWDQDKDETADFSAYTFYFRTGNVFEAVSNSGTVTGVWNTGTDDGTNRLNLSVSSAKPLSELNDNWIIIESGEHLIRLQDDNTGHPEEVVFEK